MKTIADALTSSNFKKAARKAIFAIVFFILSYLILFVLSLGLVVLCGVLGGGLIFLKFHIITLGLGIGLIGLGVIVFIFLIKFLFKKHKIDRAHLIELKEEDAPKLYAEIRDIVEKVQTQFPKKIYLSHEVNASVFYDSTFLSLIFPVRKNLQIGMALINSVSKVELKAILAHEFGHFSQRSMKVGSYVYTVNQIIYNMLYDNEGYGRAVQQFASVSGYFSIFAALGIKIITGIQWVLRKLYQVVNLQHLGLSREMEFHADAIAVNTIGSKPFVSSLMRLDLANYSYDKTLGYYEQKIGLNIKPQNIYPQHQYVMNFIAEDTGVEFVNGLPNITSEYLNRYNKSKLVVKNQWASHPSTEDRVTAIMAGSFPTGEDDGTPASDLFSDIEKLQSAVTALLFANVQYKGETVFDNMDDFTADYLETTKAKRFPPIFNGYYDSYNPSQVNLEQSTPTETPLAFEALYSVEKIDMLYLSFSLATDIETLKQIQTEETAIKSFEYDGEKYQKADISDLLPKLEEELAAIHTALSINDASIVAYFKQKAKEEGAGEKYLEKYQAFLAYDTFYNEAMEVYTKVASETQFVQYTTPFAEIENNFLKFVHTEKQLKEQINKLKEIPYVHIEAEMKEKMDNYLSKDQLLYFSVNTYKDDELDILFHAASAFSDTIYKNYFEVKKVLLEEMSYLQEGNRQAIPDYFSNTAT